MPPTPLCFVHMPFGQKPDASGATVDFDAVYRDLIAPAIEAAGLKPVRVGDKDSSVLELLDWLPSPGPVAHSKTDTFREQAEYSLEVKAKLAAARKQGVDACASCSASSSRWTAARRASWRTCSSPIAR